MMSMSENNNLRQEYNRQIIKLLSEIVEAKPDYRFGQILFILNLDGDQFDVEPERMLDDVCLRAERMKLK
jgi:hypothetical protein